MNQKDSLKKRVDGVDDRLCTQLIHNEDRLGLLRVCSVLMNKLAAARLGSVSDFYTYVVGEWTGWRVWRKWRMVWKKMTGVHSSHAHEAEESMIVSSGIGNTD
jgi:hypothetical protein